MSRDDTRRWLAELQAQFGEMLRTPLERSTGRLRAPTQRYERALCAAVLPGPKLAAPDRLAVYHRQYWFRLFGVLQHEYLLTARLVGMWHFNELAASYLGAHPPAHHDIQQIAPGFVAFLSASFEGKTEHHGLSCALLLEAAAIDAAFSRVFLAPSEQPLRREALARLDLSRARLMQAESVALVRERWPLIALRRQAQQERSDTMAAPPRLAEPQHWLIQRKGSGHAFVRLERAAFRLFELLNQRSLTEALGVLESELDEQARTELPKRVRKWLQEGMSAGLWVEASV